MKKSQVFTGKKVTNAIFGKKSLSCNQTISNMNTSDLIKEIKRLPVQQRILVIEKAIHSIRKSEEDHQMKNAAEQLISDYLHNPELTAFTNLDYEDFYETR
jgi:hypothetical protein